MQLIDVLQPQNIRAQVQNIQSKKRALELVSSMAAEYLEKPKLTFSILDALVNREKLGSTGLGQGVALPHCRLNDLTQPIALLVSLEKGIDYQGLDNHPVDIILALLVPIADNEAYLDLLASIAEQFSHTQLLERIRSAQSTPTLYNVLANIAHG